LDNAIRYSPESGRIQVSLARQDKSLLLTISNSNKALPGILSKHVFQRFVRGPGETEPGSGLGLSIASKIVEQHGAEISMSCVDNSTRVKIEVTFKIDQ